MAFRTDDPRTAVVARLAEQLLATARDVAGSAPADHPGARRLAVLTELLGGSLGPALAGDRAAAADALEVALLAGGSAAEAELPPAVLRTAVAAAHAVEEAATRAGADDADVLPLRRKGTA